MVGLDMQVKAFILNSYDPFVTNFALVIVHAARYAGATDFRNAVHGRCRHGDTLQRICVQCHAFEPFRVLLFDEGSCHVARDEHGVIHHRRQERQVVADAFDLEAVERHAHVLDRLFPGRRPGAELGDHRVVVHRDLAAFEDAGVVPHNRGIGSDFCWRAVGCQTTN